MTKQPTRLSSFSIPREPANLQETQAAEGFVVEPVSAPVPLPGPTPVPLHEMPPVVSQAEPVEVITSAVRHRKPKEADIPRTQVGARIPAPLADRLADYCHYERARQQDVVAEAILEFLIKKGF
jgi:hypothetical protein